MADAKNPSGEGGDKPRKKEVRLQIQLDDEMAQGIYSNLAMVNHTETEFVIDFIFVQPQQPKAKVRARIVSSPAHTKRLAAALVDNINKYEARHGSISGGKAPVPDGTIVH